MATNTIENQKVVSRAEWASKRKELLKKEKEYTRLRDELSRQRLELPWVRVEKTYTFDGPKGKETLADLFDGRSQLIVYHFMFAPEWNEGCPHCSFWADNFNPIIVWWWMRAPWPTQPHRQAGGEIDRVAWPGPAMLPARQGPVAPRISPAM